MKSLTRISGKNAVKVYSPSAPSAEALELYLDTVFRLQDRSITVNGDSLETYLRANTSHVELYAPADVCDMEAFLKFMDAPDAFSDSYYDSQYDSEEDLIADEADAAEAYFDWVQDKERILLGRQQYDRQGMQWYSNRCWKDCTKDDTQFTAQHLKLNRRLHWAKAFDSDEVDNNAYCEQNVSRSRYWRGDVLHDETYHTYEFTSSSGFGRQVICKTRSQYVKAYKQRKYKKQRVKELNLMLGLIEREAMPCYKLKDMSTAELMGREPAPRLRYYKSADNPHYKMKALECCDKALASHHSIGSKRLRRQFFRRIDREDDVITRKEAKATADRLADKGAEYDLLMVDYRTGFPKGW